MGAGGGGGGGGTVRPPDSPQDQVCLCVNEFLNKLVIDPIPPLRVNPAFYSPGSLGPGLEPALESHLRLHPHLPHPHYHHHHHTVQFPSSLFRCARTTMKVPRSVPSVLTWWFRVRSSSCCLFKKKTNEDNKKNKSDRHFNFT